MLKTMLGRINILIYQEIVVKENGAVAVGVDELELLSNRLLIVYKIIFHLVGFAHLNLPSMQFPFSFCCCGASHKRVR